MRFGVGGSIAFAAWILVSCRHPAPARPVAPLTTASEAAPPAPSPVPFVPLVAEPTRKAKLLALAPNLDALLAARATETGTTASAVGLVLEGEVVYVRGFGVRDLESKQAVDGDTLFRIASISKTITSLAVLKLRDQGKLVLDAPAATYLQALASLPRPANDSPPITVRHLLTMTSGLPYDNDWGPVTFGLSDAELSDLLARGPSFAGGPGEKFHYSNLGFALLGEIVEAVSGMPFAEFVAREIFTPLGMKSTGYVTGPIPRERLATGYYKDGDRFVPEPVEPDGVFAPAGGAYTSINDLTRYAAYHLAAYPPRSGVETGPVRRSTLREMHTGQAWGRWGTDAPVLRRHPDGTSALTAFSYGLGWTQNTTCLVEGVIQHSGFEPGYLSMVRVLPTQGLAFVTLSASGDLGDERTFERVVSLLRENEVFERAPATPSPALSSARDTVVQLLTGYDSELVARSFDPFTQRYSYVRNFRADIEAAIREHGKCQSEGKIIPMSATHGRFRVSCERGAIEFVVFLTPHPKPLIQNLELSREMPVSDKEVAMAQKLAASFSVNSKFPANALAPGVDPRPLENRLARLRASYGDCSLERPLWNNAKGEAVFRLRCREGLMNLKLRLEPKTSLLVNFFGARHRDYGAVCAE